jgi:hypothetical protein
MYIAYNQEMYKKEGSFISGYDFSKRINKLKKNDDKYSWICNYSSKAIQDAILKAQTLDEGKTINGTNRKTKAVTNIIKF